MFKPSIFLVGSLIMVSMIFSKAVSADEPTFEEMLDSIVGTVHVQMTTGKIEELDFAGRTGLIGGYKYHFGPSTDATPLEVKMLGRSFGALELLAADMDVEVHYFSTPSEHRIAVELVEIEQAEEH